MNRLRRLLDVLLGSGEVAGPVIDEPYAPNAIMHDAWAAGMRRATVTLTLRCATLCPPHVRRTRWHGLTGADACSLSRYMLAQFLGVDPHDGGVPVRVRRYRVRIWWRFHRVMELYYRHGGDGAAARASGLLVRLVETG